MKIECNQSSLAFIQHHLEATEADGYEQDADVINPQLAFIRPPLPRVLRWIGDERARKQQ
jgi:hypothetical protein